MWDAFSIAGSKGFFDHLNLYALPLPDDKSGDSPAKVMLTTATRSSVRTLWRWKIAVDFTGVIIETQLLCWIPRVESLASETKCSGSLLLYIYISTSRECHRNRRQNVCHGLCLPARNFGLSHSLSFTAAAPSVTLRQAPWAITTIWLTTDTVPTT